MAGRGVRFSGSARFGRGCVVGVGALIATVAFHASAGGPVSVGGLVPAAAIAVALGTAAGERRQRFWKLAPIVCGVQAMTHVVLTVGGGAGHAGHGADVHAAHAVHGASWIPSPVMVAAHVGAGLVTAVLLATADSILHRWIEFWAMLRAGVPVLPVIAIPGLVVPAVSGSAVAGSVDVDTVGRRGPPSH